MRPYECPFCGLLVSQTEERTNVALRAFEQHLDVHTERGDRLTWRSAEHAA